MIPEPTTVDLSAVPTGVLQPQTEVVVFYDGDCPLCMREVAMLERLDRGRGQLGLIDIAAPDFDARSYGLDQDTLMGEIHAFTPDGRLVRGMEVFRRAYGAVGLGWVLGFTRWPGVSQVADAAYRWFAKRRLSLTGRGDVECAGTCERRVTG